MKIDWKLRIIEFILTPFILAKLYSRNRDRGFSIRASLDRTIKGF